MPHCICSARALQVFIHDFTGLSIRHSRPQYRLRGQGPTSIGTRPSARRLQSATCAPQTPDHGYLPFNSALEPRLGTAEQEQMTEQTEAKVQAEEEAIGEQWHAEGQLVGPLGGEQAVSASEIGNGVSAGAVIVDAPEESTPVEQIAESDIVSVLPLGPRTKNNKTTKELSRLKRKERRLEAGTFKPSARELLEGSSGQGIVESVLEKIKAMDGPALPEKEPKEGKPRRERRNSIAEAKGTKDTEAKSKVSEPIKTNSAAAIPKPKKEPWQIQKAALDKKFGTTGWQPRKRLSPDTLEGIRALHKSDPASFSTATLAEHFKITPEAIRRILKSKWRPSEDVVEDRRKRWEKRGVKKWSEMAEQGVRPPAKWRALGVKSPKAKERDGRKGRTERGESDDFVRWADA